MPEQNRIKSAIHKAVRKSDAANMIISSEHCSLRLDTPERIAQLKTVMSAVGLRDVAILVYLRPQADFAYSVYAESIKNGQVWDTSYPKIPKNSIKYVNRFDYEHLLGMWSDVFGEHAVTPRIFQRNDFRSGTIERDFVHAIGAAWDDRFQIPIRENVKMSKSGLELMRRINGIIPRFIGDAPNPIRTQPWLGPLVQKAFGNDGHGCPPKMISQYESRYKSSNEAVRAKWFPERTTLFDPKPARDESPGMLSESEYDQLAEVLAKGWLHRHETRPVGSPERTPT